MKHPANQSTETTLGRPPAQHRGMAPLEMVLVLPILVAVFMLIMYVGFFSYKQAHCVAEARNDAWHKRHTEAKAKAYNFRSQNQGEVIGDAKADINFPRMFDFMPRPKATHIVMGDSWHAVSNKKSPAAIQRAKELNTHWNMKLQMELLKYSEVNQEQAAIDSVAQLRNILTTLPNAIAANAAEKFGAKLAQLQGSKLKLDKKHKKVKKEAEAKAKMERKNTERRIAANDKEIERIDVETKKKEARVEAIDDRLEVIEEEEKKIEHGNGSEEEKDKKKESLEKEREKITDESKRIRKIELPKLEEKKREEQDKLRANNSIKKIQDSNK